MTLDAAAVESIAALRASGIRALLLKGPVFDTWLYGGRQTRAYGDVDLLVAPSAFDEAESVLTRLGFREIEGLDEHRKGHATTWERAVDGARIDLHRTLVGIEAPPEHVWSAFVADAEETSVGGVAVDTSGVRARVLSVALHAAQHGARSGKPLADLERALACIPVSVWRDAAALAHELDATSAFAVGLRLRPDGVRLAAELGLASDLTPEVVLRSRTPPPLSRGFGRLARTGGVGAKARLIARELVPSPEFMRFSSSLARRGPLGLAAAYVWRTVWLALRAPAGLLAWRRATREARSRD